MKGIWHTGITVPHLETVIPFYQDALGLKLIIPPTDFGGGEKLSTQLGVKGANLRLAVFEIPSSGECIECLEYVEPKSPIDKPMDGNALGAMHVALRVDDIYQKVEELKKYGANFLAEPDHVTEGNLKGWHWVYFLDPWGIKWELVQYDEN